MAESYPQQQSPEAEWQRLAAKVKQEQVQLVADQRQLRQQRNEFDRVKAELDARQRELDAAVHAFQRERQALDEQRRNVDRSLDIQRADLQRQQDALARQTADLRRTEQDLYERQRKIDTRQRELDDRQQLQQSLADRLTARQQQVESGEQDLLARRKTLEDRQAALDHLQAELASQEADLRTRAASVADEQIQRRQKDLERQAADLAQAREQLRRQQDEAAVQLQRSRQEIETNTRNLAQSREQLAKDQAALREQDASLLRQRQDIDARQAELRQQKESLDRQQAALTQEQVRCRQRESELQTREEQLEAENRRLREQSQALERDQAELAAARESLHNQHDPVTRLEQQLADRQRQAERLQAELRRNQPPATKGAPAIMPAADPVPPQPGADDIAALAAHAVHARRRAKGTQPGSRSRKGLTRHLLAALAAAAMGVFVGFAIMRAIPARYWIEANISPLPAGVELEKAQDVLAGRLAKARIPGASLAADRSPVTIDAGAARLTVQMLSVSPEPSQQVLQNILTQYRVELASGLQDDARAQQDRALAEQVAATEAEIQRLRDQRQALHAEAEQRQPQVKAYDQALAAVEQARKDLDEANRKAADVAARLRVLRRTIPGARVELPPDRIEAATASDPQLAEVRGQVIARATELRNLLAGLLAGGVKNCDQMDSQVDAFLKYLAGERERISDEALRAETSRIADHASRLRDIVQRSRKQIDGLSAALARSDDVAQAGSLVAVHEQSEKTLESLSADSQATIQQVDDLLEKIPAGGVDVTRRTVLQQRLRSRFAEVRKTHHELNGTLNNLRPAVNFRLDAALTAVSGLSRRLQERQKALLQQVQEQDSKGRRQDYDRQVQQAEGERDELAIERDRLMARLTEATQSMLNADAARAKGLQIAARIEDLDTRIAEAARSLDQAKTTQASLQAAATQSVAMRFESPREINRNARIASAASSGAIVCLALLTIYALATRSRSRHPAPDAAPPPAELATSRN